jgi:uncharacterized FlaG/YvyC family protein
MKQRFTVTFLLCVIAMGMYANPITREQARQKAAQFLTDKKGKRSLKAVMSPGKLAPKTEMESYYVFDRGNDEGYVIVSGDDETYTILGYTDQGSFDYSTLPPNMKEWLDDYASQIAAIQTKKVSGRRASIATHPRVEPLVKSKWSQGYPYNLTCPEYFNDGRSVTGCVATAMAQLLYYNREKSVDETQAAMPAYDTWSAHPTTGQHLHVEGIPEGSPIDWANMKDEYGSANDKQRKAVADLMHYCGVAVKMDYTNKSSGAQSYDAYQAFTKYFGYGSSVKYVSDATDDAQWDNIIYNEIQAQRPIYISGANSSGGHAFVCDGYDGNYCYHINWGWGGTSDGYYLLTNLTPGQQGIGGSGDGYTAYREIIIGLEPVNYGEKAMSFTDSNIKKVCIENWDANKDGKLTYGEAAAVTDLGTAFKGITNIRNFQEFYYFTGITTLSDDAFNGCTNLTSIRLPKALKAIGARSFKGCEKLTQLALPTGLITIGEEAFCGCKTLGDMILPTNLKAIEAGTFRDCAAFTSVDLPISVTSIGNEAFAGCTGLKAFSTKTFRPDIIMMGTDVFKDIELERATLTAIQGTKTYFSSAPQWSDFGKIKELRERSGGQFATLEVGKTYYIYNIGTGRYLTKGEAYGTQAVVDELSPMRFKVNHSSSMAEGVYYLTSQDTGKDGKILFRTSTDGNVGKGVNAVFVDGRSLTSSAYWSIQPAGEQAYTIQIPSNISGYNAKKFLGVQTDHASNAASPTYGIYSDIDYEQYQLNCQWYFVRYDEEQAANYEAAKVLENLLNVAKEKKIGTDTEQAVYDDMSSTTEQIRQAQRSLRKQLNFIDFEDNLVRETCMAQCDLNGDGEISFYEATEIKDIELQFNIAITSFDEMKQFKNLTTIYANTFNNCNKLTSVVLPESVERIYYYAFRNCSQLQKVNLSEYLIELGTEAFGGCTSLKEVSIACPTPENIHLGNNVFRNVNLSECTLRVPFGAKEHYENADVWKEFGTIVEMRTNAQPTFSPITTGKSGYIFNLSSRKFLNRGEAYGTQSVVAKKGLSYQFRQTNAGNYYLDSDGKILFRTSTDSKVGAGVKTCFYDGTASSKAYWTIVQNPEDNTFTMQVPQDDTDYVEGEYLGAGDHHSEVASPSHGAYWDMKGNVTRWAFITQEDMQAATAFNKLTASLEQLLEMAQEEQVEATTEQAVYNNAASTSNDIEEAIASLRKKLHFIAFNDLQAKAVCVKNWDLNDDGELSEKEAASVSDIGELFRGNSNIKTFEELRYFTSLKEIPDNAFRECSNLVSIYLPERVEALGKYPFSLCTNLKYVVMLNPNRIVDFGKSLAPSAVTYFVPENLLESYLADPQWGTRNMTEYTGKPVVTGTATRRYGSSAAEVDFAVTGAPIMGEPAAEGEEMTDPKAPVGTYPITITAGTITTPDVQLVPGVLTITPATLTVTAKSYSREYGTANPVMEYTIKGFRNREKAEVLTKQPIIECDANELSPAGEYEIRVSGAEAQNYEFTYVSGTLTIVNSTGISPTPAISEGEGDMYDMQGRKVKTPQRGIYIKNKKKVIIKE